MALLDEDDHHSLSSLLGGDVLYPACRALTLSELINCHPYRFKPRNTRRQMISSPYIRHSSYKDRNVLSVNDHKNFQVSVDVQQFSPEEITVKKVNDDTIVVECKHEEKEDEHGHISRHFVRKYKVPKGHDITKCAPKLSSDGVLTITIPKVEKHAKTEVEIPIVFTNLPSIIQSSAQQAIGPK